MVASRIIMLAHPLLKNIHPQKRTVILTICVCFFLGAPAMGATPIKQDPKGFFGSLWGKSLKNRSDLKEIDSVNTMQVFSMKHQPPQIENIVMESVKLYTLEEKYARALFHYQGETTHTSLLEYLENRFGKIEVPYGSMIRGLNQQYTWRGLETEITLTYHGFRERGILAVESRIYAPLFLDTISEHSH